MGTREPLEVREITNKYGTLLHMGTKKRLDISQPHIENLTHEVPIVNILEKEDYDVFIDVGAGFGYFTRIAGIHAKQLVMAFEPHPIRYGILTWNVRDLENTITYNDIVGTFHNKHFISPHPTGMVGAKGVKRVVPFFKRPYALDEVFIYEPVKVIVKVDVEGNELDVIRSGDYLKTFKNIMWIVELHRDLVNREELLKEFEGYEQEKILDRKSTEHWKFYK